jgi:hypothetical protein
VGQRGSWHRETALDAGRLIYGALPSDRRPAWAARLRAICTPRQLDQRWRLEGQHLAGHRMGGVPETYREVEAVVEIAGDPSRWGEAHDAFREVR